MGLSDWFAKLLGKRKEQSSSDDEAAFEAWHNHKSSLLEKSLGKEHDMVMHAIIPFAIGGGLDLYYYPHGIPGTAIATKELSELPNQGPSGKIFKSYELVMFTRHPLSMDDAKDDETEFGQAHCNMNAILNLIARYAQEATLNPGETCEFPEDMERVGGKCLVFDAYDKHSDQVVRDFGLLAVIEVFRSEMDFAREHGGSKLIKRLRERNFYPYSDLDREAVA